MAEQDILDLVGDGEKQIQAVIERLKEMLSLVKDINANQIKIESKTSGSGSVKDLRANIDELNKTQAEFARTLQEIKKQEDALIQTQAKLNASYYDEAKALAQAKAELQARNREMTNAAKAAMNAGNAYERMNVLHQKLVKHAQQLGAKYGVTSKEFEVAANRANNLGKRLVEIDAQLGNHRRNVGNYASAWNGLQHQMGMVLRELPNLGISLNTFVLSLSNNLPMLFDEIKKVNEQNKILASQGKQTVPVLKQMLSAVMSWQTLLIVGVTILTKYGDAMFDFVANLIKGNKQLTEAEIRIKSIIEVNKSAASTFADVSININTLKNRFLSATSTMQDKMDVIKRLNELYGDQIGEIKGINEAEDFFIKRSDKFVEAMRIRAQIEGAYDLMKKKTTELLQAQEDGGKETVNFMQKIAAGLYAFWEEGFHGTMKEAMQDVLALYEKQVADAGKRNVNRLSSDVARQNRVLEQFINDSMSRLAKLSEEGNFNFFSNPKKSKDSSYDPFRDEIKSQSEYLKELAKLDEQRLREEAEYNRREYEDDKKTLEERLQAYKLYMYARSAMADAAIRGELEDTQNKIEKIKELEERTNKTYTDAENSLLVMKEALMVRERRLREQLEADKAAIYRQGLSDVKKITNEEFNEFKSQNNERIADTFRVMEEEVTALKASYDKRKISFRKFRAELRRIQTEQALQAVDASIAAVDNEMEANKDNAEYYALLTKYKIELENKRHELVVKNAKSEADLTEVELRRTVDIIKTIYNAYSQVSSEIRGMISDRYRAEQEEFKRQLEHIEERKNKEIEAINAMALSDEERINRVSAAEAKAAVERAIIEKRERQSRIRQAQFEKQAAITEIILKTSIAVMEAWSTGNYIAAASAGAVGAAQLARAMAAPIPQYASGTDNAPEGLAIVGEKGRELKITPEGEVSLTPGKATLDYLKKGTKIIPADETNKIIRNLGTYGYPLPVITKDGNENVALLQAINEQTKQVVRNLKGLKDTGRNQESINWQLYLNQKTKGIC